MKKLMIVVILVATAAVANAQRGYDRNNDGYNRRGNDYGRNERKGNYGRNSSYDKVDSYQREARRQIAFGIETGRITSRESKRLLREVEKIEYKENRYKRDGSLDSRERKDLMEDLTVLNRWINNEKHDEDRISYEDFSRNHRGNGHHNNGRYEDRYNRKY